MCYISNMSEKKFIPGEMVWLVSVRNTWVKNHGLVMCLEEDFPIQTFLKGSEIITMISPGTTNLFMTEEASATFIEEFEERISMQNKLAVDLMVKEFKSRGDQSI